MALIQCSECGRQVSDKAPACPGCGAPVAAAPPAMLPSGGNPMPVHAPPPPQGLETTYYTDQNGIRITNTRAIVGNRTFSMANLTTVTVGLTTPPKGGPVGLIVFGLLMLLGGAKAGAGLAIIGLTCIVGGVFWYRSIKDIFHVRIGAAGGETNAMSSHDRKYIESVAHALNEAIVRRG